LAGRRAAKTGRRRGGPYDTDDQLEYEYNDEGKKELHWQREINKERHGVPL
jgi:hypothetical protein